MSQQSQCLTYTDWSPIPNVDSDNIIGYSIYLGCHIKFSTNVQTRTVWNLPASENWWKNYEFEMAKREQQRPHSGVDMSSLRPIVGRRDIQSAPGQSTRGSSAITSPSPSDTPQTNYTNDSGFPNEDALLTETLSLIQADRSLPPSDYICHSCGKPGHWIEYCAEKLARNNKSYMGQTQSVGHFHCPNCHTEWLDKKCFKAPKRKCFKCGHKNVEPKKMFSKSDAIRRNYATEADFQ